jgi:hypothetical protein
MQSRSLGTGLVSAEKAAEPIFQAFDEVRGSERTAGSFVTAECRAFGLVHVEGEVLRPIAYRAQHRFHTREYIVAGDLQLRAITTEIQLDFEAQVFPLLERKPRMSILTIRALRIAEIWDLLRRMLFLKLRDKTAIIFPKD